MTTSMYSQESLKKINIKENIENNIYKRFVRLWLVAILLILPFQLNISSYIAQWSSQLSDIINNLDELTVVVFLLLAIGEYYNHRKLPNRIFFFYFLH
ncbi:MAG: hypothetical protein HZB30_10880 [Nitrospirae bacterium]|nr:hypothetical protein [Nitrospirota bacterium]